MMMIMMLMAASMQDVISLPGRPSPQHPKSATKEGENIERAYQCVFFSQQSIHELTRATANHHEPP
jgi:hypothetical protein